LLLIYLCGAWIAGIFIGSQFNLALACVFFGLAPPKKMKRQRLTSIIFFRYRRNKSRGRGASPLIAFISADPDEYGHPHPDVLERLEEKIGAGNIYRTDEDGTIEFITDGGRLWVEKGG
jgi:hypothetical protein